MKSSLDHIIRVWHKRRVIFFFLSRLSSSAQKRQNFLIWWYQIRKKRGKKKKKPGAIKQNGTIYQKVVFQDKLIKLFPTYEYSQQKELNEAEEKNKKNIITWKKSGMRSNIII